MTRRMPHRRRRQLIRGRAVLQLHRRQLFWQRVVQHLHRAPVANALALEDVGAFWAMLKAQYVEGASDAPDDEDVVRGAVAHIQLGAVSRSAAGGAD